MKLEIIAERNKSINEKSLNIKQDLNNRFCQNPFSFFEIKNTGEVLLCCGSWLPEIIGNLNESSMQEIFNCQKAQDIRRSILDGSFSYCDHAICPKIQSGHLPYKHEIDDPRYRDIIDNNKVVLDNPTFINFVFDPSCNLSCPSCRVKKILHTSGTEYEKLKGIEKKIIQELEKIDDQHSYKINVTGSGDPFGSKIFRDFLFNFDGSKKPNLKIDLQTNGVMFTKSTWEKMYKIHNNINSVIVSIDAATKETYDKIRIGGDWNLLMKNLVFINSLKEQKKINVFRLDYVVQKYNYREMKDFIKKFLSNSFSLDAISFSAVNDWGTWDKEVFLDMAIWNKDNPLYKDFLEYMDDPIFKTPRVWLGNLTSYTKGEM